MKAAHRGWVRMHRGWMASGDFKPEPFTEREAFAWSVEQAAHRPHIQWFNGAHYQVDRGEFVTSSRKMADAFGWSEKRARLFAGRMERCQKWAMRGAHKGAKAPRILSVRNYAIYQQSPDEEGAGNGAGKGGLGAQQGRSEDAEQKNGYKNGEEGERKVEASPPALSPRYSDAVEAWSQIATAKGWKPAKPVLPLADARRKQLGQVLKQFGFDGWITGLQRAADSSWLGGPDPPGWFNFSFVIQPKNFIKLIEGAYDSSFANPRVSAGRGSQWLAANQRLAG